MVRYQNLKLVLAVAFIAVFAIVMDSVLASGGYEIVGGASLVNYGTLTDTKLCIYTASGNQIVCNTDPGAAAAAGDTGNIQYNTSDALDAEAAFAYSASLNTLTVGFASTTGVTATDIWSSGRMTFGLASGTTMTATSIFGPLHGNADTATALAADPADCSANQFATTIAASGALTCASIADADIPDDITASGTALAIDGAGTTGQFWRSDGTARGIWRLLWDEDIPNNITVTAASSSATATALGADPTDCGANNFATAIAASGNLTCAAIADADVPDGITASGTALAIDGAGTAGGLWMSDGSGRGIWRHGGAANSIMIWGTVGLPTWISTSTVTVGTALKANNIASSTDPVMTYNLQNIAINTTVASSGIRYHDGTVEMALNPQREKSFVIASSTLAYMASSGTTTLNLINWPRATTVTQTSCIASAGTAVYQFSDGTNLMRANAIANTLKVYTEGTNNTFVQNEGMSVAIGTVSGVGYITCTVYYYNTAD